MDRVTVVTATRGRPDLLRRAIGAVCAQCCDHVAQHLILVDDCVETAEMLAGLRSELIKYVVVPRENNQTTGVYRMAELRDIGAEMATTPWLTYLDDDNEWEPTHLHELLSKAEETGSPAIHSWRLMTYQDGSPYLRDVFPWTNDDETGRAEYWRRVQLGVYEPGSNLYKDGVRTEVDGGEWLLATELARKLRFECVLTEEELVNRIGEDDKFLEKLPAAAIPIACTERPTLIYRLGGQSNHGYGRV